MLRASDANRGSQGDTQARDKGGSSQLVDCPIRHLGTEKAQDIYYAIEQYLIDKRR